MARILIADDLPANRMLLEALVESFGHTPVLAADGLQALERMDSVDLAL